MGAAGFNAVAAKLPLEFIAPLHMGYLEDYFTVRKALWGSQVKRIADLKGRPVALNTRGAAVEWMLDQVLRRDGLTIKDVQIKIMPFPDMVPALESGAVDAGIVTEPFPTLAEDKGVGVRPLERPAGAKAIPITATFWNAEWAKANPDLAHRVMLAYVRAVRDLAAEGGRGTRTSTWTRACSTACRSSTPSWATSSTPSSCRPTGSSPSPIGTAPSTSSAGVDMGGPDMAPHTPQCSGRPGAAVAPLDKPTGPKGRPRPRGPAPHRARASPSARPP